MYYGRTCTKDFQSLLVVAAATAAAAATTTTTTTTNSSDLVLSHVSIMYSYVQADILFPHKLKIWSD